MGDFLLSASSHQGQHHLTPKEFDKVLEEEDPIILDTRNIYEYAVGHFKNATPVNSRKFSDFEFFAEKFKTANPPGKKKCLMYCTGGVRCEQATAKMRELGYEAYQLKGGIHRYLEQFPDGGRFEGTNLVFDKRDELGPISRKVVGRCFICDNLWDSYSTEGPEAETKPHTRCSDCRIKILVCADCQVKTDSAEYSCAPRYNCLCGTKKQILC